MLHQIVGVLVVAASLAQLPNTAKKESKVSAAQAVPTSELAIEQGKIRGLVEGSDGDLHVFRGIPFAAPPVGELRWKAPRPAANWEGVRDCFVFGPACPQKISPLLGALPLAQLKEFNEDCLTLNVYRPAKPAADKLPVMVWIHGGGYTEGAGSQGLYDGAAFARGGVVFVSFNYRLGSLGFMAHPALSAESPGTVSGNYGILDQIEALRWVQKNIKAFGGDPDKVTIFGESAGGGSVVSLLVAPAAKGLFHRAIAQSVPEMSLRHLRDPQQGKKSAEQIGEQIAINCGLEEKATAADLRKVPLAKLLEVSPSMMSGGSGSAISLDGADLKMAPIVDGVTIPEPPNAAIAGGRFNKVPLVIGATRDECAVFLLFARIPTKADAYRELVNKEFGSAASQVLEAYPAEDAKSIREATTRLLTDLIYGTEARHVARHSAAVEPHTYKYVFSRASRMPLTASAGAHHGCEIPFVFGVEHPLWNWTDRDRELSNQVRRYWVNFATSGDPNGGDLPKWPAYAADTEQTLEIGDEITPQEKYRHAALDVIDAFLEARQ